MPYKYYSIFKDNIAQAPKDDYGDDLQALVDSEFYNAPNWYTIQEEISFASGTYQNLDVRIDPVVNTTTGANQGDDWKKITFKDITKAVRIGAFFQFDSNFWVTVNTNNLSNMTSACTVRRCNNKLKWIDTNGARHSIPCVLDYRIQENRDYATGGSKVVNPSGLLEIITQLNSTTNLITANQRFLFGNPSNWTSYQVEGGGINNFNSNQTASLNTTGLLNLTTSVVQLNLDEDDLVNGYANAGELTYSISLNSTSISGIATDTFQLSETVFLNGKTVSRTVNWSSSDTDVATVSSAGLVTFVATGSAIITASLAGDILISTTCAITVNLTPISEYVVVHSPSTNYILEGDTQVYNVTLELNGATQADVFTFAVVSGTVPVANYTLATISGNSFSVVNNEKYLAESLVIRATSGIYTKDISILLKGYW